VSRVFPLSTNQFRDRPTSGALAQGELDPTGGMLDADPGAALVGRVEAEAGELRAGVVASHGVKSLSTVGGFSPLVVVVRPRGWSGWFPRDGHVVPRVGLGEWFHSFPAGGVGEADAVAGGDEDVGVVHEPVDEGGGDGAGHEFVEAGGVQVR